MKRIIIAGLVALMATPVAAMPIMVSPLAAPDFITTVQSRGHHARSRGPSGSVRHGRGPSRGVSHRHVRGPSHGHFRGHPRHYRRYYRSRNNSGAVAAGIIGGMLIGGIAASAIAQQNQNQNAWANHVAWCSQRFRSFRASDNTWQPYSGPRRQCISPF